ncbi:MAG TPA: N-acetyltransferase [Bryobacteraceae bacterium]|nr:N-acetyltransferase [Bryobacteraceae bacterium]
MAAMADTPTPEIVDLWQVRVHDLDELLTEEVQAWREQLDWDFRASADLVRRFVDVHALSGYALYAGAEVAGYSYLVCEEHKGLIGDLFLRAPYRTAANENTLLSAIVDRLMHTREVRRIETQLMLGGPGQNRALPVPSAARSFVRNFMVVETSAVKRLSPRAIPGIVIDNWREQRQDDAAHLISAAYRNHIDSEINDQYRSASGARRFLFNIVQYPGCGSFFAPASFVALSRDTGRLCGVSLASLVAQHTGHITQICVAPAWKGKGVGYELMRHSLASLAYAGANRASLTVTATNARAVQLYESIGFRVRRQFPALVWEGF